MLPSARARVKLARVSDRVLRFTASERGVHWITALGFFSLLVSGWS
jgi:cytochrome b subunit of formate dehydrogenase